MPVHTPVSSIRKSLPVLAGIGLFFSVMGCASQPLQENKNQHGIRVISTAPARLLAQYESAGRLFPEACKGWRLDKHQTQAFFAMAEEYVPDAYNHYDHLPCEISGELQADGERWRYRINAAGTASWQRNGLTRHFACTLPACEPLVLMLPSPGDV